MKQKNTAKVAVITGATGGIGSAIARTLSEAGYSLVLSSTCGDKLNALAAHLSGPCVVIAGNLRAESLPETLLSAALNNFGRCDVCFNNSGLVEAGTVETLEIERMCNMIRVNVEGAFRMAYTFLKYFVRQGHGHLFNTSSILGKKVRPTVGAYAATKYAIEALSEALRMELGKSDVHVSSIEPGVVRTGLQDHWEVPPEALMGMEEPLDPEEIAKMVLFVLEEPANLRIPQHALMTRDRELALT
jgi:NADP-dependent 3-hydroxy acid dehydrogenase YdfG